MTATTRSTQLLVEGGSLTSTPEAGIVVDGRPLSDEEVRLINAYWRAANYLSVGQIYLLEQPAAA